MLGQLSERRIQLSGIELSTALWDIQNQLYPDPKRRPYVLTGCHFQTLGTRTPGSIESLEAKLTDALARWQSKHRGLDETVAAAKTMAQTIEYLQFELSAVRILLRRKRNGDTDSA